MLGDLWFRVRTLLQRKRVEAELDEELRFHFERQVEKYVAAGMKREEARRRARLEFGGLEQTKEECRDARGVSFIETLLQDVRYGVRMLLKNPGFTAVAALTLALGIGANTAVFSVIDAVLLRPLPYPNWDRLVMVWERVRLPQYQNDENDPSPGNYADWKSQNEVFEDIAAIRYHSFNLTGEGEPVRVEGEGVSASFFSVLGSNAALGRVFTPEEDRPGGPRVVVMAYGLWASRFGSDARILGKTILLDGESYTVVGVMPANFHFPDPDDQLWVPLALRPEDLANHGSHYLRVIARLKPQVTLSQARAQMDALAGRLTQRYPETNAGQTVNVVPLLEQMVGRVRPALLVLFGAVALVLLIVCANVASLLLARASVRRREMAIRVSLGAGRSRIVRQLLTESTLLALLGGGLGLLFSRWGMALIRIPNPQNMARVTDAHVNGLVLGFSLGISLLAGLLFGMMPAFQAVRSSFQDALRESVLLSSTHRRFATRNLLIIGETALAVIVVLGAGLLLRSFLELERIPLGFQPQNVLTFRVIPRGKRYAQPSQRTAFYQQAIERISALPHVKSAAAITFIPLTFVRGSKGFSMEGRVPPGPGQLPMADYDVVTPDYFRTMQIPLLEGRDFSWSDASESERVILINHAMARTYWPNEDPIGKRIRQGPLDAPVPWLRVVGVVGNIRRYDVASAPRPAVYFPVSQFEDAQGLLRDWVVRIDGDPAALTQGLRGTIWAINKNLPISRVQTMERVRSAAVAPQRFNLLLLGLFGCLALILASVGVYGVTSYAVGQRTREMGIRMALGARPRDVLRMVLGDSAGVALIGVGIGVVGALGFARLMASLLFGVGPADPVTFISVALLLSLVALAASYIPARRAMRVDPIVALRYE